MPAKNQDTPQNYLPIPPEHILPGTRAGFEIYLKQGQRFVLYAKDNDQLTEEHRSRLGAMGARKVYISAGKEKEHAEYVQKHLARILNDESIPVDVRSETWSNSASRLAEDVYEANLPATVLRKRVQRIRQLIEMSRRFFDTPEALKELARFIDCGQQAYNHGIGTMVYALCVMQTFDPDQATMTDMCIGSMLHDIGKATLPATLSEKDPETMTPEEFTAYMTHPVMGVRAGSAIPLMPEAIHCVLFHHERMDGKGYPSGATEGEIPLTARVTATCNTYDGLTRDQPWRERLTPFEALKRMRDDTGAHDPDVFKRLVQVLSDSGLA
ncbi:HD-GYP domain-containing protein [Pseudodesulfovibrio senegalensis]|uniref:HD domain-containing protein n=1 Tax=Pseudodesulfovibrio senegalensis TaxID=1721087 RepID=A0A6N6N3I4_9BACT|nr:HD domain-containing phosphohydrolase [Pseudodesulfovibrio senegalensis]KAB1441629.1 HD domain-containing protein [Pseudodesulfovibrio senegalensis]